jgi:hypothetical protein
VVVAVVVAVVVVAVVVVVGVVVGCHRGAAFMRGGSWQIML